MKEKTIYGLRQAARVLVLAVVAIVAWWLLFAEKDNHLSLGTDDAIDITPEQIESIKAIGEWEFLSISNEELVDTVRKGLFKNDELVRIYYGTIRLGVDMKDISIQARGDSILLMLPHVGLLDKNFIDEARTKAFYESGKWTPADRETLYRKARRQMLGHALTPQNLQAAEDNGDAQLRRMMKVMGYNNIIIRWKD